jgi:phage terminase large subunit-like protein
VDDALAGHDPRTVVRIYSASKDADPFEDDTIRQANPAFGDFQNADEVRAMAEDARRMPSRESQYRNLVLNQRVEASSPFISRTLWGACSAEVAESWGTRPVFGGLDLSSTTDLTALALVCEVDGVVQVRPTFWLPEEGLAERSRLDRVPYDVWHEQGYLQVTPGRTVDYEFVARYLIDEVFSSMKVRRIAFDRWAFNHLRQVLSRAGVTDKLIDETFVEFGQGFQSMSPALHGLETLVLSQRLAHGGHPVLNMCAWNSVVTKDPAGNRKLNKAKSRGRIDGMVALAMATAVRATTVEVKKNFRMAFV